MCHASVCSVSSDVLDKAVQLPIWFTSVCGIGWAPCCPSPQAANALGHPLILSRTNRHLSLTCGSTNGRGPPLEEEVSSDAPSVMGRDLIYPVH